MAWRVPRAVGSALVDAMRATEDRCRGDD